MSANISLQLNNAGKWLETKLLIGYFEFGNSKVKKS